MSKKIFYIYNPKTLTYERVYPSPVSYTHLTLPTKA